MPDPFVDHVTPEPRRFDIQADGNDGTDIIAEVNGKTVKFLENFGTPSQQGTPLSATELNKRIIGDFEDKTFTELRTLLDTLNIDKDQNANMVVNKILMRAMTQFFINGDFVDVTGGLADGLNVTNYINLSVTNGIQSLEVSNTPTVKMNGNIFAGIEYVLIVEVTTVLQQIFIIRTNAEIIVASSELLAAGESKKIALYFTPTLDATSVGVYSNVFTIGNIVTLKNMMLFETKARTDIENKISDYIEGKAKTVDPHLLTIGEQLFDKSFEFGGFKEVQLSSSTGAEGATTAKLEYDPKTDIYILTTIAAFTSVSSDFIEVDSGKDYFVSIEKISSADDANPYMSGGLFCYDSNKNFLGLITNITFTTGGRSGSFNTTLAGTKYIRMRLTNANATVSSFKNLLINEGNTIGTFKEYNSNEDNKFGFIVEGNSVTNNVETVEDTIELKNNKYIHIKRILEDEENFQTIGGVSGNWFYDALNINFEIDFATLGIDPYDESGQALARIIIDGDVYTNNITASDLEFIFTTLNSGNRGIHIVNKAFVTTVAWAAYIAAATEIVFDFYMLKDDWEENEIAATGYTVIEENGTVVEENDELIAYETETEIPVNVPAAIKENTLDIRRLHNIKNEYVVLEDFRSDNLDIPSTGTPGIFTTDKMSAEYSSYILLYELAHLEANQGLGIQRLEFINPYFTDPVSGVDHDIKKKLGRIRQAAAGGDLFLDYEFTLYFLVATPNQLGIGSGASYQDQKKTAATNVYFGKVASTSIDVIALLGVKSNE